MTFGRAAWQTPFWQPGTQGGVAFSSLRYKLGKDFSALDSHGTASNLTLFGLQSLQRSRLANAQAQASLDFKRFEDWSNGARTNKRATVLALGASGNRQDADSGATTQGGLTLSLGRLQLDARTAGDPPASFAKLAGQVEHQRGVADNLGLTVRLSAQWAFRNLDSSEKFGLGGPQAVRAYGSGAASADDAALASAELNREFWGLRGKVFVDVGAGRLAHQPASGAGKNSQSLAAVGVGVDASLPAGLVLQSVAALPLGDNAGNERSPVLWLQLSKSFF
jgi:hemolysin activation/secretion protein